MKFKDWLNLQEDLGPGAGPGMAGSNMNPQQMNASLHTTVNQAVKQPDFKNLIGQTDPKQQQQTAVGLMNKVTSKPGANPPGQQPVSTIAGANALLGQIGGTPIGQKPGAVPAPSMGV